jgi:hypothetical protein
MGSAINLLRKMNAPEFVEVVKLRGITMRISKFTPWVSLALFCFVSMPANAEPAYACSVAEIFECTAITGCQRVPGQQANLPPLRNAQCQTENVVLGHLRWAGSI